MSYREEKIAKARELFLSGYNCAQAVAGAFAPEMGMEEKAVVRLAGGLGGGLGGIRVLCGAFSASCLVMSQLHGYDEPDDMEGKKSLYALEQRMGAIFTDRYETLNCRELLAKAGIEAQSMPSERTPEYYRVRPCVRYVEACAGILADELQANA